LFLAYSGTGNNQGGAGSENGPDANKTPRNVTAISAKDLLDKYARNEQSADGTYKDKWFDFEATVLTGTDNVETVRLIVSATEKNPSILCIFGNEWAKELSKIKVGEKRRIRGRCMGKYTRTTISVWFGYCSLPDSVPSSADEVRADEIKGNAAQDALLESLKKDKGPIFDCALESVRAELPKRFGAENTKDAVIPTDHKKLRLGKMDPWMLDDQGREDTWVVHGQLTSKGKDGKRYRMNWEVTVIAEDGKLGDGSVGIEPLP
jgi:hypothetical protein